MKLNPLLASELLAWYRTQARILPWRKNKDPYRVWISEIMLQQTRVEAVIPFYERFLNELPSVKELAEVEDDRLMKLWQGLGYYSRARNLKKAAGIILQQFSGVFPTAVKQLRELPGIGEYTAGAIASIAFEQPEPAVDGNVLRVIARICEYKEDPIKNKKIFSDALRLIYPKESRGDFTQSLMELGATVCLPNGKPKCKECPLKNLCSAFKNQTFDRIPVPSEKKARKIIHLTVYLAICGDFIAIRKRPSKGLLAGLYEFPNEEGILGTDRLSEKFPEADRISEPISGIHIFTHVEWHMTGYLISCKTMTKDFLWVSRDALRNEYSIPSAFQPFFPALNLIS